MQNCLSSASFRCVWPFDLIIQITRHKITTLSNPLFLSSVGLEKLSYPLPHPPTPRPLTINPLNRQKIWEQVQFTSLFHFENSCLTFPFSSIYNLTCNRNERNTEKMYHGGNHILRWKNSFFIPVIRALEYQAFYF